MGTLVLHLAQYVHPARAGFYTILSRSFLRGLGLDFGFVDEHELKIEGGVLGSMFLINQDDLKIKVKELK